MCVCLLTALLKKYLTHQLHVPWGSSVGPRDEVILFCETSPRGKVGPRLGRRGGGGYWPNDRRYGENFKDIYRERCGYY